jgi:hypothetical protein
MSGEEVGLHFRSGDSSEISRNRAYRVRLLPGQITFWHDDPPALDSGRGTGCSICDNSKFIDIFLRKHETSATISAMRNSIAENSATHADEPYDRARCVRIYNQTGFSCERGKFLFESAVTR